MATLNASEQACVDLADNLEAALRRGESDVIERKRLSGLYDF